jgi:hypothetical protein
MKKVQRKQEKKKNKKRLVDHLGLGVWFGSHAKWKVEVTVVLRKVEGSLCDVLGLGVEQ